MSNKTLPIVAAVVLGLAALTPVFIKSFASNPQVAQIGNSLGITTNETASHITPQSPDQAKTGYSLGYMVGSNAKRAAADLNKDDIMAGFRDAYGTTPPALTQAEMEKTLMAYQQRRATEMQQEMKTAANTNLQKGQAFLAENGKKQGITTTASGLQYEVLSQGTGAKPKATDTVSVNYEGKLIDGKVFDSTAKHGGQPAVFPLNQVIPGWTEGVQLMPEGSKYRFYVPANLAYGEAGAPEGGIEPNSVLIFDVELLKVNPKEAAGKKGGNEAEMQAQIKAAIEAAQAQQKGQAAPQSQQGANPQAQTSK